jgi:hypothetical protein
MISGLAEGMSSFGKAIATHGKEGGAAEVEQEQNARMEQQRANTQLATQQKQAIVDTQFKIASANTEMARMALLAHSTQVDDALKAQEVTKGGMDINAKAQDTFDTTGRVLPGFSVDANTGAVTQSGQATPAAGASAVSAAPGTSAGPAGASTATGFTGPAATTGGAVPAAGVGAPPTAGTPSIFLQRQGAVLDAAAKELQDAKGNDDPLVTGARKILADPNSNPTQIKQAVLAVQSKAGLSADVKKNLTAKADLAQKQQAANPLFKFESDPKALADPGAQATLQAYIADPANAGNLSGIAQAKMLVAKAGIAQQHDIDLAARKSSAQKTAEQNAAAGKPEDSGALLADGTLTLTDLKSRGSTPKQIVDAVKAATRIDPKYNASDEVVGEHTLSAPTNQVFFGSARSLVQGGGMLDQLKAAHDALGAQKIPSYNTIKQWTDYQAGTPELATYRAALLNTADDAAKVMGGGTPTDSLRAQFMKDYAANINNLGFDGAIKQAKSGVRSQVTGRIGSNRYIATREGDILKDQQAAPAGATSTNGNSGSSFFNKHNGKASQ